MDKSSVIYLIAEAKTQDQNGVWRSSVTKRRVFCNVQSVSRTEFFEGGRNGLNPEYIFTMFFGDYNRERMLEYEGETYAVYRTYRARTDEIELYVERQGGVNGITDNNTGAVRECDHGNTAGV